LRIDPRKWSGGRNKAQEGLSLLVVLMALAISGLIAISVRDLISNSLAANRHYLIKTELRELQTFITFTTSCARTKSATPTCAAGEYLNIHKASGAVLIAKSAPLSKYGKYKLRAVCRSGGKIEVEYARGSEPFGNLFKDSAPFHCEY